jgi:hypothetical protein
MDFRDTGNQAVTRRANDMHRRNLGWEFVYPQFDPSKLARSDLAEDALSVLQEARRKHVAEHGNELLENPPTTDDILRTAFQWYAVMAATKFMPRHSDIRDELGRVEKWAKDGAKISREISALSWGSLISQLASEYESGKPSRKLSLPLWKLARETYQYPTVRLLGLAFNLIARAARRAQMSDENRGRGGQQNVLKAPSPETALVFECVWLFELHCPSQIKRGKLLYQFVAACFEVATGMIDHEFERAISDQVREYHMLYRGKYDDHYEDRLRERVRKAATPNDFDQRGRTEYEAARAAGWNHPDAMEIALARGGAYRSWRL